MNTAHAPTANVPVRTEIPAFAEASRSTARGNTISLNAAAPTTASSIANEMGRTMTNAGVNALGSLISADAVSGAGCGVGCATTGAGAGTAAAVTRKVNLPDDG